MSEKIKGTKEMHTESSKTVFGIKPLKVLFAMEYFLQGMANPFQGITYHPFFRHFRFHYGLSESATQNYFSMSYLAWSFKPVIGFLMDAFGKTKVTLVFLLGSGMLIYLLTPLFDVSALAFFTIMFLLSVVFAATDVAVDRATVIEGEEESKTTGRSRAATVGLNQAICWAAIYGTNIVAGVSGGWIADNIKMNILVISLAIVPLLVLLVTLQLPKDRSASIPLKTSVMNFWTGLNTGPIVWIVLFYFLFHFQPAMGALWTNYLITNLQFSQTQLGLNDGVAYFGYFLGVLLFAWAGIKWQDKLGLKFFFKIFILLSIVINLTQYLLIDPYFSAISKTLALVLPGVSLETARLLYLSAYYFVTSIIISFIRMSTFSLVGAVIPVAAAGSLFAGFMSVSNLAYSFSYSSGSWLYEHGMNYTFLREIQSILFKIEAHPGDTMSISMLILIGSFAYLLSFISVHMLPDKKQTQDSLDSGFDLISPEHFKSLGTVFMRNVTILSWGLTLAFYLILDFVFNLDSVSSVILTFFSVTFVRKVFLDYCYKKQRKSGN